MTALVDHGRPVAPRQELFGIPIDSLTLDETVDRVRSLVRSGGVHRQVSINASKVVETGRNADLRRAVADCDVISADGMSIVWASRILRRPLPERVAGIELFLHLVAAAAADGDPVYLLGAAPQVVEQVAVVLARRYPDLKVAGYHHGFWVDDDEMCAEVRRSHPTYLFLAIPSPRKELWLEHYAAEMDIPYVMGVGGSFDVIAGTTRRAPDFVQRAGFEWAWRLLQEPRRMWRRYLIGNSIFIGMLCRELRRVYS